MSETLRYNSRENSMGDRCDGLSQRAIVASAHIVAHKAPCLLGEPAFVFTRQDHHDACTGSSGSRTRDREQATSSPRNTEYTLHKRCLLLHRALTCGNRRIVEWLRNQCRDLVFRIRLDALHRRLRGWWCSKRTGLRGHQVGLTQGWACFSALDALDAFLIQPPV